jgi:NitT/TauT family transport system substrate-binding protein
MCRRGLVSIALVLLLGGAARGDGPSLERVSLTVGVALDSPFMLPFHLAAERTARDENLELRVVSFGGGPRAAAALAAGSIDIAVLSLSTVVNLVGSDHAVKGFYTVSSRPAYEWFARAGVRTWSDLHGRSVAVSTLGSITDILTREVLRRHGIEPGRDVTVVGLGEQRIALAALRAGRVDAAVLLPPSTWTAEAEGFTRLGTQAGVFGDAWPRDVLSAREGFLRERPQAVRALLRAVVRAIRVARDGPAAIDLLERHFKYERPIAERARAEVMMGANERGGLPSRAMPLFWTVLTSAGEVSGPMPEARFFDARFVDTFDAWAPPAAPR